MCLRNVSGFSHNYGYPLTEITFNDFKKILPYNILKQIKHINFNGNLGDFAVAQDADKILEYVADYVPNIQVETNGSVKSEEWWSKLAKSNVQIMFALDGLNDTHNLHRIDTNFQKILKNAIAFINNGGYAIWKFIKFNHNNHQINAAKELANKLGFKHFIVINSERNNCAVFERSGEFSHWIGKTQSERNRIQKHEYIFDSTYDFEVACNSIQHPNAIINCIDHYDTKKIFIAGDGSVYPCCFTGIFPLSMQYPGNQQLKSIIHENNAILYGLEHSIKWFDNLYKLWNKKNIQDGKPLICLRQCSKQY